MATVNVDRRLLGALAGVAGLSLLAVAFLLGRASGGPAPAAPRSIAEAPAVPAPAGSGGHVPSPPAGTPASAPAFAAGAGPAPPAAPAATQVPDRPAHAFPVPTAVPAPEPPLAPHDPERESIAAYLDAIDAIQASGISGSPESAANEMAAALARGDASGLDALVRDTEDARRRLLAVAPPAACAAHHRETVASLDDGLAMLRALREATASGDPSAALADVAARATALKTRAETLKAEEEELRRRGGRSR